MGLVDVLLIPASRMTLLHQSLKHPESTDAFLSHAENANIECGQG